jgi:hypothetical protein
MNSNPIFASKWKGRVLMDIDSYKTINSILASKDIDLV